MTSKNIDIFLEADVYSRYDEDEEPLVSFYTQRDSPVTSILRLARVSEKQWVLELAESSDFNKEDHENDEVEI